MDYEKLRDYLKSQGDLVGLYYYTGKVGTLEKQFKFIKRLEKLGYIVKAKEVKFIKINNKRRLPIPKKSGASPKGSPEV